MDARLALPLTSTIMAGVLFARLGKLRLLRQYPWFATYLLTEVAQAVIMLAAIGSKYYVLSFVVTTSGLSVLRLAVSFECWSNVSRHYPGIKAATRLLSLISGGAALGVTLLFTFDIGVLHRAPTEWAILSIFFRATALIACVFCGLVAMFSGSDRFFKGPVPGNAVLHARILSVYFLSISIGFLLTNLFGGMALFAGNLMGCGAVFCYVTWISLFSATGEAASPLMPFTAAEIAAIDWSRDTAIDTMRRVQWPPITRLFLALRRRLDPVQEQTEEKRRSADA